MNVRIRGIVWVSVALSLTAISAAATTAPKREGKASGLMTVELPPSWPEASPFALELMAADDMTFTSGYGQPLLAARTRKPRDEGGTQQGLAPHVLTAERARVLLQSLTIPGWGQATLGGRTSSTVFLLAEAGVWTSFTAFRVQEQLRRDAFERTARVLAGIDLSRRDEEFRRIVGSYISSEEYNLLVVSRDAANLYYDRPDSMNWYIDLNSLKGADAWSWVDVQALLRYRGQRKDAQRARLRTSTALGLAVVNRVLSVIHAARASSRRSTKAQSLRFEAIPVPGGDPTAFRLGVRTEF